MPRSMTSPSNDQATPRWTRARLARYLGARYGWSRAGGVDAVAVGEDLGVSPATVRRWLGGGRGGKTAQIPSQRLEQLGWAPDVQAWEAAEDRERRRAVASLQTVRAFQRAPQGQEAGPVTASMVESWKAKRWLEPHVVALVTLPERLVQLVVARADLVAARGWSLTTARYLRRRGNVQQAVVVPTRFDAAMLVAAVLRRQGPWRAEGAAAISGRTQCWFDDAPPVDLSVVAAQESLTEVAW